MNIFEYEALCKEVKDLEAAVTREMDRVGRVAKIKELRQRKQALQIELAKLKKQ